MTCPSTLRSSCLIAALFSAESVFPFCSCFSCTWTYTVPANPTGSSHGSLTFSAFSRAAYTSGWTLPYRLVQLASSSPSFSRSSGGTISFSLWA